MVLTAGRQDTPRSREALAHLCQTYWHPVYVYVRRRGYSAQDAEDLTQGFFARLLELDSLGKLSREGGRFRSFLLSSVNHYLADVWDKSRAAKRGLNLTVPLDTALAEAGYAQEPADMTTPEVLFERRWAMSLLDSVAHRLSEEFKAEGKAALFDRLSFSLTAERSAVPYAALAQRLGMSEPALRVAVHRLRQRYRRLLREEIADTVASPAEVEDELRYLMRVLAR
jgi:RNA polymerase sigma factor (sigma-70 family)